MSTFYVIGDLHFQGKGRGDELGKAGRIALRTFLMPLPDRSVILNGDILDLLRESLAGIEKNDEDLLALLFRKARAFNAGNHDRAAREYMDGQYRGVPVTDKLIIGDTIFLHGDLFDLVNSQGRVFGETITRIVDWLADRIPGVMKHARKLEAWARKVGRFGGPAKYRELAFDYIRTMEVNGVKIRRVVLNHTHKKDHVEKDGMTYLNSGTWINGKRDFLKIEVDSRG